MQVTKNNLSASQVELIVELSAEEMARFVKQAAEQLSFKHKIEGFRPGKAPLEVIENRFGEMVLIEEAAHLAIAKTIDQAIKDEVGEDWVGRPEITVTKMAPQNDFAYKALLTLLPEVKLGDYKNLKLSKKPVLVSEAEVNKVLNHLQDSRAKETTVDRSVGDSDKVIVDVEMFLNNVPLEGGQAKALAVVMGKDYFVPGFDKNLLGAKRGDEREFKLHYPADYQQKNLAGQAVDFKVKIKDVFARELPKLDQEFVATFGLKDETELRNNIKQSLEHEKKHEAEHKLENEMLEKIVKASEISELPKILIDNEVEIMLQELEYNVKAMGAKFDDYLLSLKKTITDLKTELVSQAEIRVKTSLVLRAIIKAEALEVSASDIDQEINLLKQRYQADAKALETLNSIYYRRQVEVSLLNRKAMAQLIAWNVS